MNKWEFNYEQMEEIYRGIQSAVDVSTYAKPEIDANLMKSAGKLTHRH